MALLFSFIFSQSALAIEMAEALELNLDANQAALCDVDGAKIPSEPPHRRSRSHPIALLIPVDRTGQALG